VKKKLSEFGKEIEGLLLETDLTREDLAQELGISVRQISHWMRGYRNPKKENKDRIIEAIKKIATEKGKDLSTFIALGSNNIGNVKGSNNIVGKNKVDCYEALDLAKKYIKKLEEEIKALKKKR
jgi:transcriptional regulator with XRE-family HTH domain